MISAIGEHLPASSSKSNDDLIDPARYGLDKYEAELALADYKARKKEHKRKIEEWRKAHEAKEGL
jgi:hypothetical protein